MTIYIRHFTYTYGAKMMRQTEILLLKKNLKLEKCTFSLNLTIVGTESLSRMRLYA